jgi:hypothetical protein
MSVVGVVGRLDGTFVLRQFVIAGDYSEPVLDRDPACSCKSSAVGSGGPNDADGASCFVEHYRIHDPTCALGVSVLSPFLGDQYGRQNAQHRGDIVFLKSSAQVYVNCNQHDLARVEKFVRFEMKLKRCAHRTNVLGSWCSIS